MTDIETQQLLYHLTDIENLKSIFKNGLLPRYLLEDFSDVADDGIIDSRRKLQLEKYVPFHFFARNPFDESVQSAHKDKEFVLIAVRRAYAKANA